MVKKLTKTGNSLALIFDRALLEATGIDGTTPLEVSTDGDVILVSPRREAGRTEKLRAGVEEMHRRYGGVFQRLAE